MTKNKLDLLIKIFLLLSFILVMVNFLLKNFSFISILLSLELFVLYFLMFLFLSNVSVELIIFFLFISVLEAILGLSLLLFTLRQNSNENLIW